VDNSDIEPELLHADEIVTGLVLATATAHAVRPVGDSVRGYQSPSGRLWWTCLKSRRAGGVRADVGAANFRPVACQFKGIGGTKLRADLLLIGWRPKVLASRDKVPISQSAEAPQTRGQKRALHPLGK
jgi:hypothetical protein